MGFLTKVNEISSYIHGHRLDPGKVLGSIGFFDKELIVKVHWILFFRY